MTLLRAPGYKSNGDEDPWLCALSLSAGLPFLGNSESYACPARMSIDQVKDVGGGMYPVPTGPGL
jgi:hypothetical protein